jgi:hypothetical protein
MPTIRELFKSEVKGLTGGLYKKSKIYIESQGAINPPRLKALALSSPNSIADLAGITVAAALGVPISSANRPGDTIFNSNKFYDKPLIGLAGPLAERNTGIINPTKAYYVKPAPAPYQVVNQIKNGISTNPLGTLITAARNELRDGTLREVFAKRTNITDKYGSKYQHLGTRSKPLTDNVKFSESFPTYDTRGNVNFKKAKDLTTFKKSKKLNKFLKKLKGGTDEFNNTNIEQTDIQKRKESIMSNGISKWDQINNDLLIGKYTTLSDLEKDNKNVNIPYVAFEIYGKTTDNYILLPGTIASISEDVEPSWNTYKYVGSPFNTYRYSGVERSIKFDLKLYANGVNSLANLQANLEKLRETVFPDTDITQIEYGNKAIYNAFSPNLLYLTISGYYKKLFGFIDGLNISVDDSVPWPTGDPTFDGVTMEPYPAVINVSISMKIIETVSIGKNGTKPVLVYNMTDTLDSPPTNLPKGVNPSNIVQQVDAAKEAALDKLKLSLPKLKNFKFP